MTGNPERASHASARAQQAYESRFALMRQAGSDSFRPPVRIFHYSRPRAQDSFSGRPISDQTAGDYAEGSLDLNYSREKLGIYESSN